MTGVVLWLFVMNLGVVFGAGVYEHRIVLPRWLTRAPDGDARWNGEAAHTDDVGRRFWAVVSTLPLTALTLASLVPGDATRRTGRLVVVDGGIGLARRAPADVSPTSSPRWCD